jgi:hypothetical protein
MLNILYSHMLGDRVGADSALPHQHIHTTIKSIHTTLESSKSGRLRTDSRSWIDRHLSYLSSCSARKESLLAASPRAGAEL